MSLTSHILVACYVVKSLQLISSYAPHEWYLFVSDLHMSYYIDLIYRLVTRIVVTVMATRVICPIDVGWSYRWWCPNRPVAQIPQCTKPISHNAPFYYRNVQVCTFLLKKWCIVGYLSDALWDLWDGAIVTQAGEMWFTFTNSENMVYISWSWKWCWDRRVDKMCKYNSIQYQCRIEVSVNYSTLVGKTTDGPWAMHVILVNLYSWNNGKWI